MSKMKKKILSPIIMLFMILLLSGCNWLEYEFGMIKEEFVGRKLTVQTYDENSQLIDRVSGDSVSISADGKFRVSDSEGNTIKKSSVLNITVGGKQMLHVGSSLIAYEDGLENIFEDYIQTVDIDNFDKSVPFVNKMINDLENVTKGKSMVILIRSQSGQPLATFVGDSVSYFSTDIDKSTGLMIDGKYLFIYRCDYSIYETSILQ